MGPARPTPAPLLAASDFLLLLSCLAAVALGEAESKAVCRAQGDPHYTTFDGRHYNIMGTCTYSMVELCGTDPTLPAFAVEAKNEHRTSRLVSYVSLVTVRAYSQVVMLARGETGFARVSVGGCRHPCPQCPSLLWGGEWDIGKRVGNH